MLPYWNVKLLPWQPTQSYDRYGTAVIITSSFASYIHPWLVQNQNYDLVFDNCITTLDSNQNLIFTALFFIDVIVNTMSRHHYHWYQMLSWLQYVTSSLFIKVMRILNKNVPTSIMINIVMVTVCFEEFLQFFLSAEIGQISDVETAGLEKSSIDKSYLKHECLCEPGDIISVIVELLNHKTRCQSPASSEPARLLTSAIVSSPSTSSDFWSSCNRKTTLSQYCKTAYKT